MASLELTPASQELIGRHPSDLSPVELGAVLDAAGRLESYIKTAREEAERRLIAKKEVDGWELEPIAGKSFIPDTVKAARQVGPLLKMEQILACSKLAIGKLVDAVAEAEKVDKKKAKEIVGDYLKGNILRGKGGFKLVPKVKEIEVGKVQELELEEDEIR